jgi:hypothetical protein
MRSLSQQSESELGGIASVLVRQKRDHVRLDELLHALDAAAATTQDAVLRELYRLVFPHAFAEESVLWPVIRRLLPDGETLTLRIEQEHQEVNELVTALESHPVGSSDRPAVLRRLSQVLREDVRDEEDELLPRLQQRLSARQLRVLGLAWEVTRRIAPTRAHPVVARRPPGNVAAALPLTMIDRARDRLDQAHERGIMPALNRRVSRALTAAAHRIEHIPPLTRGEHPATRSRR